MATMVGTLVCVNATASEDKMVAGTAAGTAAGPYGLRELLVLALAHNAELVEGRWRVREAATRVTRARAATLLPRLRFQSVSGLVPDAEGDVFNPPGDTTGLRPLGLFNRSEFEFVQPLFTFGYLSQLRKAAGAGVEVEEASLAERRLDVILEVKELYYGVLLAEDLSGLAGSLIEELEKKRDEINEDDPDIPLSAPYKLRLALLELQQKRRRLDDELSLAREALAWKAGLEEGVSVEIADRILEPQEARVGALDTLVATALARRPEWQQLASGIRAKKALREASRSAYYPQIYLGGGLRYAVAPGRQDQHNPFVKDDFNFFNGGVFLGLRQSFEWGMLGADADKAQAELFQLKAKESAALQGIKLDVRRAHGVFQRADSGVESARQARRLSREWLQIARGEYDMDPSEVKELISAFEAYAATEQALSQAIFDYNMALAKLERAVGSSLSPAYDDGGK